MKPGRRLEWNRHRGMLCQCLGPTPRPSATGSQPLAARVARCQIVPELDVVFVLFPAEEDLLAVEDGRKIKQAAVEFFHLNLAPLKFGQRRFDISRHADPQIDGLAAHIISARKQTSQALVAIAELPAQGGKLLEPMSDLRQEGPCLVARVMLLELISHGHSVGLVPTGVVSSFFLTSSLGSS